MSTLMKKTLRLFVLLLTLSLTPLYAQTLTVHGKVTDENKLPLVGATVHVIHHPHGTVSDQRGHFTLTCTRGDTLVVNYLGYTTQQLKALSELVIVMHEKRTLLDNVVVIGYGNMRKKDLTGAISSIHASDLTQGHFTSTEQALQGKIAGLTIVRGSGDPTQKSVIRLRGGTSLSAGNAPLIVIDGVPEVDINTVNSDEIESIDVLKGASASAIYGSRGANGVIMINTIHARYRKYERGLKYKGSFSIGQVTRNLDLLTAEEWRTNVVNQALTYAKDGGATTDWQKAVERTALSHNHQLTFFRHQEDNGYTATINLMQSQGIIQKNKMNRYAVNLSAHQELLRRHLKLEMRAHNSYDVWNPVDYGLFLRIPNQNPTMPVKDVNGNYTGHTGYMTENPVKMIHDCSRQDNRKRILLSGKATLKLFDRLTAVTAISWENNHHNNNYYMPSYGAVNGAVDHGHAKQTIDEYTNSQVETYVSCRILENQKHHLQAMLGYSYLQQEKNGLFVARRDFDTDDFSYFNLGAGNDYWANDLGTYKKRSRLISFYGRLNYHFKNRYLFTFTLRRDGSSKFGKNHKWGTFPSMSAAWRISDEAFMKEQKEWLNDLKLRIGYGVTGNQEGIDSYQSLQIMSGTSAMYYDPSSQSWKQSYAEIQNANPDLKWETTKQINVGFDLSLFHRLTVNLDFYHKQTTDLLWMYPVPQPPNLVGNMLANVGALTNQGFESSIKMNWVKQKDFTLNTNVTFSYNKQRIDRLNNATYSGAMLQTGSLFGVRGMSGDYSQVIKEGYPLGAFWGPKCLGIAKDGTYILERDKDGKVKDQYLGSAQPKCNLGLRISATYKNWDAIIDAHGLFGQKVLNATSMALCNSKRFPAENVLADTFRKGITDNPIYSSYWIEDGSFFRIQTISLGYTLPKLKRWGIQRCRCYLSVENLLTFTGYTGYDPEVDIAGIDSPGIDLFNVYPKARLFSVGVEIAF